MKNIRVSVIIPVRNGSATIEKCLDAIFEQSLKPFEVIIVDGHSTDTTIEKVKKYPVTILFEDYHTRGGGCQVGIEHASGEYIAFTDADCIPDRNWLEYLSTGFGSGVVGTGGQTRYIGKTFWQRSIDRAFATPLGSANSVEGRLFSKSFYVTSISGCNSMYTRKDVLSVGGFNTGFIAEDTELNARIMKKGKLLHIPKAIIIHEQENNLSTFAKRIHKWGRARVTARRWGMQVIPALLIPLLFVSLLFTPWAFIGVLGLYVFSIITIGLIFAIRETDPRYIVSIPIVLLIEHASYTTGIWRQIITTIIQKEVLK